MNEDRRKVMIIDGESETARALDGMLSPHWDVTAVGSVGEAAEKAEREDFDVIVTGYVLPRVSGQEGVLELRGVADRVAGEKEALLGKVRSALESVASDFQSMRPESEELLRQSEAREEKVVEFFSNQLRRLQEDNVKLDQKIQDMEEVLSAAREEKEKAVKRAEAGSLETKEAWESAERALAEKTKAERETESALKEKTRAEEKAEGALKGKAEIENEVASLSRAKAETEEALSKLRGEMATLGDSLQKAFAVTEKAVREKGETERKLDAVVLEKKELQGKLARFQENWERYVAGKQ